MEELFCNLIYILANLFGTYIVYRFMEVFFAKKDINRKIEIMSYIAYFIIISITYLCIGIPIINLMTNIIAFFLLSLNYKAYMKTRIISITIMYFIMASIETIVVLLTDYYHSSILQQNKYSSIIGMVSIKIITYAIICFLCQTNRLNRGGRIPKSYWVNIMLIPISSIYITITIFNQANFISIQVIVSMILLLVMNFSIFYLYEKLSDFFWEDMEKNIAIEQTQFYKKQFEMMQEHLKTTNELRHDLKNHFFAITTCIQEKNDKEALTYLNDMIGAFDKGKEYAYSGNIVLDSILNFKLQKAKELGINLNINVQIPPELKISSFDMTIILGNLLDNALEALDKTCRKKRYLDIWIRYDKGRFILKITNPFIGEIFERDNVLLTTKQKKMIHGIGIYNVRNTVEKYDGILEVSYLNNVFNIMVLMYIE